MDIDVDLEDGFRFLLDVYSTKPGLLVTNLLRLADLLGSRGEQVQSERVEIIRRAASLYADELNRPADAITQLETVLEMLPGDPSVLHQMLEFCTDDERWVEAAAVLETLANLQDTAAMRVKYLYAGALIVRDQLDDHETTKIWLRKVLETDALHIKGFQAIVDLLRQNAEWRELSKVLRARLKSLPETGAPDERGELMRQLGAVYEDHLEDPKTALTAYEQALRLAASPSSQEDKEVNLESRRKLVTLCLSMGEKGGEAALPHVHALIAERPMEFEAYHRLVDLYSGMDRHDAAVCISRSLHFLKQATDKELALADSKGREVRRGLARSAATRERWRQCVVHPLEDLRLSDLFSQIWHIVAAREGKTHAHLGVNADARVTVSLESDGIGGDIAHACQLLDVPVPDMFVQTGTLGGFSVHALAETSMVSPTLMVGDAAAAKQAQSSALFRAGRAVARVQPGHILASVLPHGVGLRNAVYGAVLMTHAGIAVPQATSEQAEIYRDQLKRHLPPARLEILKTVTLRVIEGGGADTKAWTQGVEFSAARMGFVLADSIEVAARVILQGEAKAVPSKEIIKDLVAFSVSEDYLRLRRALSM